LLFAFMLTIVFFVSEMILVRETSELHQFTSRSARLRVCFVAGVESVFTFSSPLELRSPVSLVTQSFSNYVLVFITAIFSALITSQLTASQANNPPPAMATLAGARIGIQGVLLKSFVAGPRMNAVPIVYDTLDGAIVGFYGDNPDRLDGVATQTDIINYFQAVYGPTSSRKTVQTGRFTATGSAEPRGYLISRTLDRGSYSRFNIALQRLRESGQLAALIASDVPGPPPHDSSDISLPAVAVRAVFFATIAAACAMGGVFFTLLAYDIASGRLRHRIQEEPEVAPPVRQQVQHDTAETSFTDSLRRRIRQRIAAIAAGKSAAAAAAAAAAKGHRVPDDAGTGRMIVTSFSARHGPVPPVYFSVTPASPSLDPDSPGLESGPGRPPAMAAAAASEGGTDGSASDSEDSALGQARAVEWQRLQELAGDLRVLAAYVEARVRARVCVRLYLWSMSY
jgi:hypothetical protein